MKLDIKKLISLFGIYKDTFYLSVRLKGYKRLHRLICEDWLLVDSNYKYRGK